MSYVALRRCLLAHGFNPAWHHAGTWGWTSQSHEVRFGAVSFKRTLRQCAAARVRLSPAALYEIEFDGAGQLDAVLPADPHPIVFMADDEVPQ